MKLVIVESPTKAKTLSRFLGSGYQIMASMGHLRDLPRSRISVDVEHNFKPDYQPIEEKRAIISKIISEAKKAKSIILATDLDREGEAIAFHIVELLSSRRPCLPAGQPPAASRQFKRIIFHEITKEAILKALEKPGKINMKLVDAQQARRVLDRLVGYKLSPLLWRKVRLGLSAGRVQSVTVKLIVEREKDREAFKPEEFWNIGAELCKKASPRAFLALLSKIDGKKAGIKDKKTAERIVKDLKRADYSVENVVRKEVKQNPPPPFITSTLQSISVSLFGWSSKKTMREAQILYENGLITYHRTDSYNLAQSAVSKARKHIENKYGKEYVPDSQRFYKKKSKLAQEAHEAIRVTSLQFPVSSVEKKLGKSAAKLYQLIFNRFLACQMAASIVDKTSVDILAKKHDKNAGASYALRAAGEVEKFDGWRKVYQSSVISDQLSVSRKNKLKTGSWELKASLLPELSEGEMLKLIKVLSEQKFTQPPPRYSEGTLIKILEKLGIGRPSTYAPTISTIQTRRYVEKEDGRFYPTKVGIAVTQFLQKYFDNIMDYGFTAQIEDDFDLIAEGVKKWTPVISEFYKPFDKKVESVGKKAERVKIEVEKTGKKCPDCKKGDIVIRMGRFGRFLSCSKFPDCKYTASYIEKTGKKCPDCKKGDMVVRRTKKGRQFFGCGRYPKCKWASWRKPKPGKNS